jgi:hypothetical protein
VLILPPCVNRSSDRFAVVDPDSIELIAIAAHTGSTSGGIRVPLTAIRGLGADTVRHILQMRAVFGPFSSLLDFLRRMEPHQISRRELQVLIRLGAFSFTGRSRAQLALVEDIYACTGELLRSACSSMPINIVGTPNSRVARWLSASSSCGNTLCLRPRHLEMVSVPQYMRLRFARSEQSWESPCQVCGKLIHVTRSRHRKGWGQFCSRPCYLKAPSSTRPTAV